MDETSPGAAVRALLKIECRVYIIDGIKFELTERRDYVSELSAGGRSKPERLAQLVFEEWAWTSQANMQNLSIDAVLYTTPEIP